MPVKKTKSNTKSSLMDEYFEYQITYEQKYGPATAVMMQVGAFFECYGIDNDKESIGTVIDIAKLLNIQLTRKNKSIIKNSRKNPLMAGIPIASFKRCLDILINNGFTVVVIEQTGTQPTKKTGKFAREVTNIYSPSTYIDNISSHKTNNLVSVFLNIESDYKTNENIYIFGLTMMDMSTGKSIVYETDYTDGKTPAVFEEVYRFIETYDPSEVIVNVKKFDGTEDDILKLINISSRPYHINMNKEITQDIYKLEYQNQFLKQIYSHEHMGFLSPIEYLNMERTHYSLISFILLIDFAYEHNKSIVAQLDKPTMHEMSKYMKLHHNTLYQLNVVNNANTAQKIYSSRRRRTQTSSSSSSSHQRIQYKSLFDVLNQTSTSMGRRLLREHLLNPLTNPEKINQRYNLIDDIKKQTDIEKYETYLKLVLDIERLHRRMRINMIQPTEIHSLYQTYQSIQSIIKLFVKNHKTNTKTNSKNRITIADYDISSEDITNFNKLINELNNTFHIDKIVKYQKENMTESIFKPTIHASADQIQENISEIHKLYDTEIKYFSDKLNDTNIIKLKYSDRDGYYLTVTNTKAKLLQNKLTDTDKSIYTFKARTKSEKSIISDKTKEYSNKLIVYEAKCKSLMKKLFQETIQFISEKYTPTMRKIAHFIAKLDLIKTYSKISKKYGYCRPIIKSHQSQSNAQTHQSLSYITAKDLRHPIIERNQKNLEYIPNDVNIGLKEKGMVLFGINSSGKSCYMKSVGLSIIMAQMGMFVPAKSFTYYPYTNIFTRISGDDNIFRGLSSFAVEMTELRTIINHATSSSLVIGDEVCRGTEDTSALAIVSATINHFKKHDINFIFTSHLHKLTKIVKDVSFYHLSTKVIHDKSNNHTNNQTNNQTNNHINNNQSKIVYTRKLTEGSGITKYGLEVASFLIKDEIFVKEAYRIRNDLLKEPDKIVNTQKSRYNSDIYVDHCAICKKTYKQTQLDVHHINFQSNCDENGLYKHIPKNMACNLVVLCKEHHTEVHQNKIKIKGYKYTSDGRELEFLK